MPLASAYFLNVLPGNFKLLMTHIICLLGGTNKK